MLLVIDIGNTNIVIGVFEEDQLVHTWRVATKRDQTAEEYAVLLTNLFDLSGVIYNSIEAVVVCSVVPPLNSCFQMLVSEFLGVPAHFIEPEAQNLMPVDYHSPADVGADRIVNAIAAYELFGGPGVVVDFGTATTFDVISKAGEYKGGIIAPGIGISAEALFARAARLPRTEIKRPDRTVGKSTDSSMQSGIFYGYVGLVDGILKRIKKELENPTVTATGGYAALIATEFDGFDRVEENLTAFGLKICHERLQG
jgi:type III pantothenate kinase